MTSRSEPDSRPTPIVVHPLSVPGTIEALRDSPELTLVCPVTEDGVAKALDDGSILLTHKWNDAFLRPGLRWIQCSGAGYEQFPVARLRDNGVVLTTASGIHSVCAEHAVGLLLALTRGIDQSVRDMASGGWEPRVAPELAGRTIVILGMGAIGKAIAQRLQGWDVRLIGVTRTPGAHRQVIDDLRPISGLVGACREASVLVVAIPAVAETYRLVSSEVFDALGPGWIVNVSRGSVVDQEALTIRLADRRLLGAGIDVAEIEPVPASSPLWRMPNTIITPHMAGLAPRYGERLASVLLENLRAYRGRGPWRNRVC